jgi:hypothetical protein
MLWKSKTRRAMALASEERQSSDISLVTRRKRKEETEKYRKGRSMSETFQVGKNPGGSVCV